MNTFPKPRRSMASMAAGPLKILQKRLTRTRNGLLRIWDGTDLINAWHHYANISNKSLAISDGGRAMLRCVALRALRLGAKGVRCVAGLSQMGYQPRPDVQLSYFLRVGLALVAPARYFVLSKAQ